MLIHLHRRIFIVVLTNLIEVSSSYNYIDCVFYITEYCNAACYYASLAASMLLMTADYAVTATIAAFYNMT